MLRIVLPLIVTATLSTATADEKAPTNPPPGDAWERALLDAKEREALPGPKPGQKCLWSEKTGACLWFTPGKFRI